MAKNGKKPTFQLTHWRIVHFHGNDCILVGKSVGGDPRRSAEGNTVKTSKLISIRWLKKRVVAETQNSRYELLYPRVATNFEAQPFLTHVTTLPKDMTVEQAIDKLSKRATELGGTTSLEQPEEGIWRLTIKLPE